MAENGISTAKRERLILALVQGLSVADAAKSCQVAERTAYRWMKDAAFQQSYKTAQKQMFERALSGLMLRVHKAIDTLDRNMGDNPLVPPSTQVSAARIVLEQSIEVFKLAEIEARLKALEEQQVLG